jgi:hypothetical protein
MMELRQASKDEAQGEEQSANNEDTGATFSKFEQHLILAVSKY